MAAIQLLLLMPILTQSLLTLVRSHLMSLVLFSVRHLCMLFKFVDKHFSGLECRDVMLRDDDSRVL